MILGDLMTRDVTVVYPPPPPKRIKVKPKPVTKLIIPIECHPTKCHNTGMLHVPVGMLGLSKKPDKPCTNRGCPYCIL